MSKTQRMREREREREEGEEGGRKRTIGRRGGGQGEGREGKCPTRDFSWALNLEQNNEQECIT